MQINVAVTDANNIVCQVTPPAVQTITIDRGVEGNGIVSIVPVTVGSLQYLRITYTDGTVSDVGPITSTAYTGTSPINITGNVISLLTVPISLGGTGQTTANAAFNALAPSQTGNSGKYLTTDGTNTSWAANPLGTVTSVDASGGTTGLTFSGGPITTSGTLTLAGTLAVDNGGTGITAFGTGVATALGVNVGSAGAFVVNGGALGTPSSGTVTNLTGTASININGTVGATTATTGAFTTLTTSSTVTLNGGTANGVAYLNGSKVLTTGSALTFDGANLGLGTTPSAWGVYKAFQVGRGSLVNATTETDLVHNAYWNGSNWIYIANDFASRHLQINGQHRFFTAPSGTAGNAISFSQVMTLDASGKLSIGTTTTIAGVTLNVVGGINSTNGALNVSGNSGFYNAANKFGVDNNGGVTRLYSSGPNSSTRGSYDFRLTDSSGSLDISGMTLDASGNLLVGSSAQIFSEKLLALGAGANVFTAYQNTNTSGFSTIRSFLQPNGNNTSTYHFLGTTSGVGSWYLYGNGTSSWSSDSRLKKNIETTRDGYLDDVCKLRVVKYNWKNDADGSPRELGLIAQEVEQIFPGLVQDGLEPLSKDDQTLYKQLKGSVLPFMLLKAIQELKAEFDAYKATHP
jgi:hypothetical protein